MRHLVSVMILFPELLTVGHSLDDRLRVRLVVLDQPKLRMSSRKVYSAPVTAGEAVWRLCGCRLHTAAGAVVVVESWFDRKTDWVEVDKIVGK